MRRVRQNEAKPLSPKKMLLRDPGTVKLKLCAVQGLTFSHSKGNFKVKQYVGITNIINILVFEASEVPDEDDSSFRQLNAV
jgi:hypothetical protein